MEQEGKGETEKKEREKGLICKRCKQTYTPSSNNSTSCRFHPSFFVCRRHDDQKRAYYRCGGMWTMLDCQKHRLYREKINSKTGMCILEEHKKLVDMYYELRPEDPPYAAKFYDCCGAEDPNASGCSASFHVSYDDE